MTAQIMTEINAIIGICKYRRILFGILLMWNTTMRFKEGDKELWPRSFYYWFVSYSAMQV